MTASETSAFAAAQKLLACKQQDELLDTFWLCFPQATKCERSDDTEKYFEEPQEGFRIGSSEYYQIHDDMEVIEVFSLSSEDPNVLSALELVKSCLENNSNYSMLESLVEQEMQTVVEREESIQLILDSMSEGLLTCNPEGEITEVRSATIESWFGEQKEDQKIWDYLCGLDQNISDAFQFGLESVFEDIMPFEVTATQMPQQLDIDGTIYRFGYQQVYKDGELDQLLVTIRDATAEARAEVAEAEAREFSKVVAQIIGHPEAFNNFLAESHRILEELSQPQENKIVMRLLHTLKGNTAIYGFESFAKVCHNYEDKLLEGDIEWSANHAKDLDTQWMSHSEKARKLVEGTDTHSMVIAPAEYQTLIEEILAQSDYKSLVRMVNEWVNDPISDLLGYEAQQAIQVAEKLGKSVRVDFEGSHVRVPFENPKPFFGSLIHVLRNAVDHGLESPEDRKEAGKSSQGHLVISAHRDDNSFELTIQDDGRGIDWERVREKAKKVGLAAESQQDLIDALMTDSFSTKDEATMLSGRGAGLGAVKENCELLGGTIHINSEPGRGTKMSFVFPVSPLATQDLQRLVTSETAQS